MRIYPFFLQNVGCPHRCTFCNQERSVNARGLVDAAGVANRLESILPEQGGGEIAFYGGSFTMLARGDQQAYLKTARQFVKQGRVAGTRISTRPDALAQETVGMLIEHGVTTVEVGCQSFDDKVLLKAGRGHSSQDNRDAVQRCLKAGLKVGVQLMPGLPGGSREEVLESAREALALEPSFLRVYPTIVLEGTDLAQSWRSGVFVPWALEQAVEACADILLMCRRAGIPVIRMGLQQDEHLEKNLLAGPYHPAFGQLVRSRLWRRGLSALSSESDVYVNPVDFSDALGHCGDNRKWFMENQLNIHLHADQSVMPGSMKTTIGEVVLADLLSSGESHVCQ